MTDTLAAETAVERKPGFYWIKMSHGWEPAEFTGDGWCILMMGMPKEDFPDSDIGPEIVAPPGMKPATDYWANLPN
jgi:hypothetical protein